MPIFSRGVKRSPVRHERVSHQQRTTRELRIGPGACPKCRGFVLGRTVVVMDDAVVVVRQAYCVNCGWVGT